MTCNCASVFNSLTRPDRLKLQGAALSKAVSGFIRDDTAAHPVRFPFYALYLLVVATPLPFPFVSTLTLAATLAWARYSKSAYAGRLNGRIKAAFNEAALVCAHKDFIVESLAKPDEYKIRSGALALHTTQKCYDDTRRATITAWNSLKNRIFH